MLRHVQISLAALFFLLVSGACFAENQTVNATAGLGFNPITVTVNKGETVTFKNTTGIGHNVIADDGSFCCSTTCKPDATCSAVASYSSTMTFNTAGTFGYFCSIHGFPGGGMHGTIIVNDTAPPTKAITNATSGVWYDPTQSGHGFMVEVLPGNTFLAVWFTFGPSSGPEQQNWLYIQGSYAAGDSSVTVAPVAGNARSGVLLNTGGAFPPNFVSTNVTTNQWGTMTFAFSDCNHATVNWNSTLPGYGTGTMNLQRLSGLDGLTCQ